MSKLTNDELNARVSAHISLGQLAMARDLILREMDARRPPPVADERTAAIIEMYNGLKLYKVTKLSQAYDRALNQRIKEHPDLDWWRAYFKRVSRSDFLTGRKTGWKVTFQWLLSDTNAAKVLGGNYDNRGASNGFDASDEATFRLSNVG